MCAVVVGSCGAARVVLLIHRQLRRRKHDRRSVPDISRWQAKACEAEAAAAKKATGAEVEADDHKRRCPTACGSGVLVQAASLLGSPSISPKEGLQKKGSTWGMA